MDPLSSAGIALSVSSLAVQVFAGCIRGMAPCIVFQAERLLANKKSRIPIVRRRG